MIASVGWAEDVTVTKTSFNAISGGFGTDPYIRYEAKKGAASTAPAVNNNEIRVYQNGGIFSVGLTTAGERDDIKIKSVTLGSSMKTTVTYSVDEGTASDNQSISANGTITVGGLNCSSVSFTCKGTTKDSRLYVNYLSVTYEVSTPNFTITAQSNNTNYGTVSLNGSVITGSPNNGYRYADPAYSVSPENSASVAQDGNAFTVTPSANTTVTINFEAIPTYTVTLGDDNSTLTEEIGNAGVTLPTRSALNGYEFAGWSKTNVATETTTAPTIIEAGAYAPTADITLYPVYTKTVGAGGTTNKTASVTIADYASANGWANSTQYKNVVLNDDVTATASNKSGSNTGKYYTNGYDWRFYQNETGKVTIATNGTLKSVTFTFSVGNTGTLNYNSSAITSGQAVSVSGTSAEFTVGNSGTATNGQVKITAISVNYDITGAGTTYYWSAPVAAAVEIPSIVIAENPFLFSTTATITCATEDATIEYSFDGENWSNYSSALTITETKTIYAKAIKGENESDVAQVTATKNLATPSVTINGELTLDLDGKTNVNAGTLTAAVTYNDAAIDGATVTWSSNKPEVATIDETTGAVTLLATGNVTFTATYAGNTDYAEATATKTVTVIDNNAPGSAGNPYTVAQAIAYINTLGNSTSANEVYVSGIISKVEEFFDKFKSITYWISDDGKTTTQMEVYSGKGLDGADFTAVTDLEVGDVVTVKGKVKKYNDTPEFDKNNHLVSFTRPEKPKHTVAFYQNGEKLSEATVEEGAAIEFPTPEEAIHGKQFVGWLTKEIDGTADQASPITAATMGNADVTYYAVYANVTPGTKEEVTDELTYSLIGITGSSYTEWSNKTVATSNAVYAGQSAGGNTSIQLRATSPSGVITTTSGGKATKVVVTWNSNTAAGRTLNIYGSNTAYTAATDLYGENAGSLLGTIVNGTSTELTINENYEYVGLRSASGALYLDNITITWESGTPASYSDYCTTVVAPVVPAAPIVFHDSGTYEGTLSIPMYAQEGATIKYTVNGGDEQTYSTPVELSTGETTITAWAELNGVASDVVEKTFTIIEKAKSAVVEDGYYTIQTNDDKYVNVAGRKTVTLVSDTKSAGTVIRVKADEDGVKVLRSQAVDLPRYAERAMSYVPELVKEVVKKLAANVDDPIIGEQGADLILDKFNKEFDYHLYLEGENNTYRIYGRTPSMKPVVDFYAENKELVDSRLPKVEGFVEEILLKVAERLHHPDSDWAKKFKVHNIWALIVNEENKLTEPVDEASTAKFFTEVLSSEANIWNFAHETAMIYWTKVEQLINDPDSDSESDYADMLENLGDYKKYLEKVPNIRPNFKYYIVPSASGVDIISEGNSEINNASTAWTLTKREGFDVTFDATLSKNNGKEMYKTLYVDFAYKLPDGVKAYAITGVNETTGVATKEEFPSNIIPAQTPVLLQATFDAEQTADQTKTLELTTEAGTTPETNLLVGADYLINEYEINTPQVESIFSMLAKLSQSLANEYSYLKRKNAGTVNNKYFFGIAIEGELDKAYKEKTGDVMENTPVRILSMGNQKLGFYGSWDPVKNNEAFIVTENEELDPVKLFMKGDVYRDGVIDEKDLTALVEIVLGKVTIVNKPDNYDFDAAYVNDDEYINIADVTALVNILKPQPQD